ncbi:hypothetical conserved protein [Candidatus Nitrosoglobus terrae]|uniref:Hypothetical conserved protein n=1 Tax=Candidatus Nitrosoglobus terrae TaxID=1630141 RepID=A0A1Q2SNW9_9GAMM|nr:YajG family lipoprotein [Candidatus Nitrosoglobus terrae]BAW80838.1 hypothetical conserved protein [Candidatus Nitrosoglobus terrae]
MIKRYRLARLVAIATFSQSGCMFHPQTVHLQPQVQYVDSDDGHGLPIALIVEDERPTQNLGHRGDGMISAAAITTDSDIAATIKQHIAQGLTHRGFKIADDLNSMPHATLTVRIRDLQTQLHSGFWVGHQESNAAAQVTATQGNRTYERFYRADSRKSKIFVSTAGQNSKYINTVLSNLIDKIINDKKLISLITSND